MKKRVIGVCVLCAVLSVGAGEKATSAATDSNLPQNSESERLAKKVKEFLVRKKTLNGPSYMFENLKGTPVSNVSAKMTHDGKVLRMVFTSPAGTPGTWEIHSAAHPANGDLLILSVDAQGKIQAQDIIRIKGGMPSNKITLLTDIATASVTEANGVRTVTVILPLDKVDKYGIIPGKESRMNFFYITEKQVVGWNPTFKSERRLPWRLGRVYFE